MTMPPRLRKLALTAHVTFSVGWLGAVAGFLALALAGLTSQDAEMVRAAYVGMELTGWYVIVPFCLAALVTGLVMSLGTSWGLFRHYWVLGKFLITVASALILFGFTQTLGSLGDLAADTTLSIDDLRNLSQSPVLHSGGGLLALLMTTILGVYKPWGITRYGRRKQDTGVGLGSTTTGSVLHRAARYDLLVWLVTLGRERAFRDRVIRLARLEPGDSVLDVGCGTGTLAIAAKRLVGPKGTVCGIDASPEMIARARNKAMKGGIEAVFKDAVAEALPFPDAQFDVVLATMMIHHLPSAVRQQCVREMRRVLRPGGRILVVDFGGPARKRRGLIAHFHRHVQFDLREVIPVLSEAGLNSVESGAVGFIDLQFVLAAAPSGV